MEPHRHSTAIALVLLALPALTCAPGEVVAQGRSASRIVREFDAIRMPGLQPEGMSEKEYTELLRKGCQKQLDLAWELYQTHPKHRRTPELLQMRWFVTTNFFERPDAVIEETSRILESTRRLRIREAAILTSAWAAVRSPSLSLERRRELAERAAEFRTRRRESSRIAAAVLFELAVGYVSDPAEQKEIYERIVAGFRDGDATITARGQLKVRERGSKGLSLETHDARTGEALSLESYRGAPVLLVVWSLPWRKDEIPSWQSAIRARHAAGLKVIGLHQRMGRVDRQEIVDYLAMAKLTWPQHVETGKLVDGWSWKLGIRRVPTFLIVTAEGRLDLVSHRLEPIWTRLGVITR